MADREKQLFQRAAHQRLTTAAFLSEHGFHADAVYLAGYAVECALKALALRWTPRSEFPTGPDQNRPRDARSPGEAPEGGVFVVDRSSVPCRLIESQREAEQFPETAQAILKGCMESRDGQSAQDCRDSKDREAAPGALSRSSAGLSARGLPIQPASIRVRVVSERFLTRFLREACLKRPGKTSL